MKQARAVLLVLALASIFSIGDAIPGRVEALQATRVSTTNPDAVHGREAGRRFLRGSPSSADSEDRAPNVEIIIKDAASRFKKSVLWKIQFAVWKYLYRRTPQQAREKMGLALKGREVYSTKNFKKLVAYRDTYGLGPLTYP